MYQMRTLFLRKGLSNAFAIRFISPACYSTDVVPAKSDSAMKVDLADPNSVAAYKEHMKELLSKELPKPCDGPERDLVNFPRRVRPMDPAKVRMAFIPDDWFQFFYKKTGVTGPYVFGAGLLTFLLSKELYVVEHEFSTGCALFMLTYIAVKKFGPMTREWLTSEVAAEEKGYENQRQSAVKEIEDSMADSKKTYWHGEGQKMLMAAKRDNVQMQLETEYRRRMMHVYEQVKKRLDYQLEFYNTKRKLEQKHMVDWIVNSVVKSITPQQEKEALQKCIEDLKFLSTKA